MTAVIGLVVMAALAALILAAPVIAVARPAMRRLAVRHALRRPREAALVVLGSLLGTAIITASFVVGDTLDASLRRTAVTQLGPVDLSIRSSGAADAKLIEDGLADLDATSDNVDGVLPVAFTRAAVSGPGGKKAEPKAVLLEVDFAKGSAFGGDAAATGLSGATPAPGRAVLVDDLAVILDAKAGDTVTAYLYGQEVSVTVDRIIGQRGVAGYPPRFDSDSANLLLAPGTIAAAFAKAPAGSVPPTSDLLVSATGGVFGGVDRAAAAETDIAARFNNKLPPGTSNLKQDTLDVAKEVGDEFTALFGGIGFFSVLAGILLLVLIFVMLAEERKSEMGMLRAMGMRRSGLVGSYYLEGYVYALASSTVGAVVGIGLGYVISGLAGRIFSADGLDLTFAVEAPSIVSGFLIGFIISMATVTATAVSIARVNVIRAIRDLPEPTLERPRARGMIGGAALLALGLLMTMGALSNPDETSAQFPLLAGIPVLLFGIGLVVRRWVPRRWAVTVTGALAVVWPVVVFGLFPDTFENADIPLFVVQGVILTAAAVSIVSQNQDVIGAVIRRVAGGNRNLAMRLGLANPLAKRFRTALILGSYSLVVFTLTFITVFSHLFQGQIDQFTRDVSGGFDLTLESNPANPVSEEALRAKPEVELVASFAEAPAEFKTPGTAGEFEDWYVVGITPGLVEGGPSALEDLGTYPDERAAYQAVLSDPSLTIVSEFFLQQGGGPPEAPLKPGDQITLRDPVSGQVRDLKIAAIAKGSFANDGAYVSFDLMKQMYGARAVPTRFNVATKAGVDPQDFADRLNGEFLANGADADSFRKIVKTNLGFQTQFFRLMQGYLAIGLVVGIAGLGVQMVRAVRERRREVGVLRSLGFQPGAVRRAFLSEAAFIAAEGIIIGVVLALITAWQIVSNDTFGGDLAFSIPAGSLALLVVGTFVASLIATATPAQQASGIRPAVALRIAD